MTAHRQQSTVSTVYKSMTLSETLYVEACKSGRRERDGLPVDAAYWDQVADETICRLQGVLLDMEPKHTRVVAGVVVTRWAKDVFELDTFGREDAPTGGSEWAAEEIARRKAERTRS